MKDEHLDLVLTRPHLADLDPAARRLALREVFPDASAAGEAADAIDAYGPLTCLMEDESVTDILVNGTGETWVERSGRLESTTVTFEANELSRYAVRWLAAGGGRADALNPLADARLPCGARLHVVLPPVAPDGPLLSIRKFPRESFDVAGLRRAGMFDAPQESLLRDLVAERRSLLISGATGSGKTTLLGALLGLIPAEERVVLIEETRELRPAGGHQVSLVARAPNVEGTGAVGLDVLVRNALRMRPDRIVVGEVRGSEAPVALDAIATGHEGSMLTIHARSEQEALPRLVSLACRAAGGDAAAWREQAHHGVDAVVHLERRAGRRSVAGILEVR